MAMTSDAGPPRPNRDPRLLPTLVSKGAANTDFTTAASIMAHVTKAPFDPKSIDERLQSASASARLPPLAVGFVLFGPVATELLDAFQSAIPWVDRDTGQLVHLLRFGDPNDAGPQFLAYRRLLRYRNSIGMRKKRVFARDKVPFLRPSNCAIAYGQAEVEFVEFFGLESLQLPAIAFFVRGGGDKPITIELPLSSWKTIGHRRELTSQLSENFGSERIASLARASIDTGARPPFANVFADHCNAFQDRLRSCEHQPVATRRRKYRAPAPAGWIYLKDVSRKHRMNLKTAQRHSAKLGAPFRKTDENSGEVCVVEVEFLKLLRRHDGAAPAP